MAVWRTLIGCLEAVLHERIRLRGNIDDRIAILILGSGLTNLFIFREACVCENMEREFHQIEIW